jgi:hypothetical protein
MPSMASRRAWPRRPPCTTSVSGSTSNSAAYDELAQQFTGVRERQIYQTSRKFRLERGLG